MQGKYVSGEQKFCSYVLRLILKNGGTRMQMVTADITKEMQVLDAKDDINLHRKRYGNMDQCLKDIKHPFFIIDSMVIKLMPFEKIESLSSQGFINAADFAHYRQVYAENQLKIIQVLKINNLNECSRCAQQYKININNDGDCPATSAKHVPKHNY